MDNKLRQYLEDARSLEMDAYTLRKVIENIKTEYQALPVEPQKVEKPMISGSVSLPAEPIYQSRILWLLCAWSPAFVFFSAFYLRDDWIYSFLWFSLFLLMPLGIHVNGKIKAKNNDKKKNHQWAIEAAQRRENEQNQQYKYELDRYHTYENNMHEYLKKKEAITAHNCNVDREIAGIQKKLAGTESLLSQLYARNIVYQKYRGLIPITMFCEYMDSGRRYELSGKDGMYDLYETELIGKQIVNEISIVNANLDKIGNQLEKMSGQLSGIMANQHMLYSEISKGNRIADEISSEIAQQRAKIEAMGSSISAMGSHINAIDDSSRIIAENTDIVKKQEEIKLRMLQKEFDYYPVF